MSLLTPKIMTFLPMLPSGSKHFERESNPISYTYLSGSAFLTNFTEQLFKVKSDFKSRDYISNS